eukprot:COSAG06_NODE_7474_length_2491_cov_29.073997_1_plen_42_part_10
MLSVCLPACLSAGYVVCLFYIRVDEGQLHVLVVGEVSIILRF